jgi:hypothetical protein
MLIDGVAGATAMTAGQVEMAIEEVLDIAKSTVSQIEDTAESKAARPFRDMEVDRGAFSEVPAAQALAEQHDAAKQVFLETIEGLVADLAEFKQRLLDSAATMEANDQSAEEMLSRLGRSYEGHSFASDMRYRHGLGAHAEGLTVEDARHGGTEGDAGSTDDVDTTTGDLAAPDSAGGDGGAAAATNETF